MKKHKNTISKSGPWMIVTVFTILAVLALIVSVFYCYSKLRDMWDERSVIRDKEEQVKIIPEEKTSRVTMISNEIIEQYFGLKGGAKLSQIEFDSKRASFLSTYPNVRSLRIIRHLPDGVTIIPEERVPRVRLALKGQKNGFYRVADNDGIVFECGRGTELLPIIREPAAPGTGKGRHLEPRAMAALHFAEAYRECNVDEFTLSEIDITPTDWLYATITVDGRTAYLKFAWEGMDLPETPTIRADLIHQLNKLRLAMRSHIGDGAVIWNAADYSRPTKIYADTKGKL